MRTTFLLSISILLFASTTNAGTLLATYESQFSHVLFNPDYPIKTVRIEVESISIGMATIYVPLVEETHIVNQIRSEEPNGSQGAVNYINKALHRGLGPLYWNFYLPVILDSWSPVYNRAGVTDPGKLGAGQNLSSIEVTISGISVDIEYVDYGPDYDGGRLLQPFYYQNVNVAMSLYTVPEPSALILLLCGSLLGLVRVRR